MNDRIKQLLEQSTEHIMGVPVVNQKRFADMIVKECLSYMEEGDIDFVKFMIKRNFGVEE